MKLFKCSTCDKILEEKYVSNHPASKITWLNATEHEDRIKEIDEMQNKSKRAEEHEKEKMIDELKKALRKLTSEELDEEEEKLREEIAQLRAEIEDLDPDKEEKDSRQASAEFLGMDSTVYKTKNYSVLTLKQSDHNTASGDKLLIKLGSTDDDMVSDSKDDEFLISLWSTE